jgi:hypothetical protein
LAEEHPLQKIFAQGYDIAVSLPVVKVVRKQVLDMNGKIQGYYISGIEILDTPLMDLSFAELAQAVNLEEWKRQRRYFQALEQINHLLENLTPDELNQLYQSICEISVMQGFIFAGKNSTFLMDYKRQDNILSIWHDYCESHPEVLRD